MVMAQLLQQLVRATCTQAYLQLRGNIAALGALNDNKIAEKLEESGTNGYKI
jgi:hypothetical protein